MNNVLQLKGKFKQAKNEQNFGGGELAEKVSRKHIENLVIELENMRIFWNSQKYINGALISIEYTRIIPKSNRVQEIFKFNSKVTSNSTIVGAKFKVGEIKKHIITHFISFSNLDLTINKLKQLLVFWNDNFGFQEFNHENFNLIESVNNKMSLSKKYNISKTTIKQLLIDLSSLEKFTIEETDKKINESTIVSLYKTNLDAVTLLSKIGINISKGMIIEDTTVFLQPRDYAILLEKAPFLVAMAMEDLTKLSMSDFRYNDNKIDIELPKPTNEPTIGVIDTLFDESVYFSEWVEYHNLLDVNIPTESKDFYHGTMVSSLIVDGQNINKHLDDGCGRFRVKHFGVATHRHFSSFSILKNIKNIVSQNPNIKVWNLSLGSAREINPSFISFEAEILDKIQVEHDVIFVIAGTNKNDDSNVVRIGSPADSINSLVVNSVDKNNRPASYSRRGEVLSFFTKPDVSYYGGTEHSPLLTCSPYGAKNVSGTSFAAPYISRKLSYLIDVLGLSREVAKALIIDSATGWDRQENYGDPALIGHGVVPIHINDIINSPSSEIKFTLFGQCEEFHAYTYSIPVPIHKDKYPYIAKATICYFPKCSRQFGVDYTNTELDIKFGRVKDNESIEDINENKQMDEGAFTLEYDARRQHRKWDNSKHIRQLIKTRNLPKKIYTWKEWGISVKRKDRNVEKDGSPINFGLVLTLREINGVNRIEEFIKSCMLKGWIVNKLEIKNKIDIFEKSEEKLNLE